jgi:hypothetical protein
LIELLMVLAILSIGAGLMLPAVHMAREAARNATCQSNLRQISTAAHQYLADHGIFPFSEVVGRNYQGDYALHARILPYIGLMPLYDGINMQVETFPKILGVSHRPKYQADLNAINATCRETRIALFVCPSDKSTSWASSSYRGNAGVGPSYHQDAEFPDSGRGIYSEFEMVTPANIPDGLSHTAAFSERLLGSDRSENPDLARDFLWVPAFVRTADHLRKGCQAETRRPGGLKYP